MRMRNAAGTVVDVDDVLAARLRRTGWTTTDQPALHPAPSGELPMDKDTLLAVAEADGISVDRRWGAQRLRDAIQAAWTTHG